MLRNKNYEIGNIDSTIALQAPKIKDFIPLMKKTLADVMQIPEEDISIKATTTEQLGFVGTGEGIAAYSSVLITKDL